jgi:hypothetical protein
MKPIISKLVFNIKFIAVLFFGLLIGFVDLPAIDNIFIADAEAVRIQPVPQSRAGAARRTTRRHVRRHVAVGTWVRVIPSDCTIVVAYDIEYYFCDGSYYEPYYEGDEIVYLVVDEP